MSANLDLVRSIHDAWDRGDFSSVEWAHPDVELIFADGPDPGSWSGLAGMSEGWRKFQSAWEDLRPEATEFREVDSERVLVLVQFRGRAKASGLELAQMRSSNASVHQIRDGRVMKVILYWDRDRAFADLGLAPARLGNYEGRSEG
jgi:ketosteroid isomerase-like protein